MKINVKHLLLVAFLFIATNSLAQIKDSIFLVCPFEHGSGREPKEAYTWNPPEKKVVMISRIDSIVRSSITGKVSNVNAAEDDKYEVVVYTKDFYIWYYGIAKPTVVKGQDVKAGQTIGICKFGTELEFRLFKNEDAIDPRNLLECKVPKAE